MNTPEAYDRKMMLLCLYLADTAAQIGEVPVGAVVTLQNRIVGIGYNNRETANQACDHAEILAIRAANRNLRRWRLSDCCLYVSLEPCLMCAGAIQQARLTRVCFGATDPKGGAYGSLYRIHEDRRLNHRPSQVQQGLYAEDSQKKLKSFFSARR